MSYRANGKGSQQPLNASTLHSLKEQLLSEKARIEKQLDNNEHFGLGDSLRSQTDELSTNDNHPADLGSELFERGKDIALHENAERHLTDINEAISRMESGEYGICRVCGQSISPERLKAVPTTAYCVEHVPDPSMSHRRPVEEKFEAPSFGRTSLDELDEQNQFDGEDAWQIVESWGSSNSPAMAENPNESNNYMDMEIEPDEMVGYVESFESFLATDIYGQHVSVIRNGAYRDYMRRGEGEGLLDPDMTEEDLDNGYY